MVLRHVVRPASAFHPNEVKRKAAAMIIHPSRSNAKAKSDEATTAGILTCEAGASAGVGVGALEIHCEGCEGRKRVSVVIKSLRDGQCVSLRLW